jgi:hypothetical protein
MVLLFFLAIKHVTVTTLDDRVCVVSSFSSWVSFHWFHPHLVGFTTDLGLCGVTVAISQSVSAQFSTFEILENRVTKELFELLCQQNRSSF